MRNFWVTFSDQVWFQVTWPKFSSNVTAMQSSNMAAMRSSNVAVYDQASNVTMRSSNVTAISPAFLSPAFLSPVHLTTYRSISPYDSSPAPPLGGQYSWLYASWRSWEFHEKTPGAGARHGLPTTTRKTHLLDTICRSQGPSHGPHTAQAAGVMQHGTKFPYTAQPVEAKDYGPGTARVWDP